MKLKHMTAASTSNSWKFEAEPTVQQSVQPWAVELNKLVKASSIPSDIWYHYLNCVSSCPFSVSSTSSPAMLTLYFAGLAFYLKIVFDGDISRKLADLFDAVGMPNSSKINNS